MRYFTPVVLVVLAAFTVQAQPFGPPPGPHNMERIEQLKKVRLVEMLDLKEEQSVRFFARLNEHENTMRSLGREKSDLLDRIERLVRNEADVKEFEAMFPQVFAVDDRMGAERRRFVESLSDLLSPEQRGKFLLFERQFERELREAMKEVRQRRNRGGGE
jgi:Spy/CpxP family protein refolding chaperone